MAEGDDQNAKRIQLLIHESEQIHETIGRALNTANALYGLVLPGAFGVVVFTASSTDVHLPISLIAVAFAGIVAATLIYNAGLWVEISRYLKYKYLVLYPELHRAGHIEREANFGVFLAREHRARGAGATLAFHAVAHGITLILTAAGIWSDRSRWYVIPLTVVAGIVLAAAAFVTATAAREVAENMKVLAAGERLKVQ